VSIFGSTRDQVKPIREGKIALGELALQAVFEARKGSLRHQHARHLKFLKNPRK
jgi:hypothetical protein